MLIRPYRGGEEMALLAIFQSSVRRLACRDYTPRQIDAWSPAEVTDEMRADWIARIQANQPWVADFDAQPVGFADLQTTGYIDHFFVAGPYAGQGIGSALMAHLHRIAAAQGIGRLFAHVSLTAQPFFTRHGFIIEQQGLPLIRNVALPNALMSKKLKAEG